MEGIHRISKPLVFSVNIINKELHFLHHIISFVDILFKLRSKKIDGVVIVKLAYHFCVVE
jgi:hypothetical protein